MKTIISISENRQLNDISHLQHRQVILRFKDGAEALISYKSVIIFYDEKGQTWLGDDWEYSNTTGKYRNEFLGETKSDTKRKLKTGEYKRATLTF